MKFMEQLMNTLDKKMKKKADCKECRCNKNE